MLQSSGCYRVQNSIACIRIFRKFGMKVFCLRVPIIIMGVSLVTKINKFVYIEMFINAVKSTRKFL